MKTIISNLFSLLFLSIVCISCHSGTEALKVPVSNTVVLIFQDCPPEINIFSWGSPLEGGPRGRMEYPTDIFYSDSAMSFASTRIQLKKAPYSDTITITDDTHNNFIAVTHRFNLSENAHYLFHKGDTVLFTYKENIPYATILNRETTFHNSNYNIFIRENVTNNRMSAMLFYLYYVSYEKAKSEGVNEFVLQTQYKQMIHLSYEEQILNRKQALDMAIEEIILEHKLQDSLHNAGLLSDYEYDYRRFNIVSTMKNFSQDSAFIQHPYIFRSLEQHVIHLLGIMKAEDIQSFGQCKNHVEVFTV